MRKKWVKRLFIFLVIIFVLAMVGSLLARVPIGDRIAVIKLEGIISDPEIIVRNIETCKEDKSVKALVLRVDSPGGAVGASQEIYRALERFRLSGKPIVVSMGNVAASGGYYVSLPANYIFANEGTIVGSIGVIVQHMDYKDLLGKIGVKTTAVKTGKFKDTLSPFRELTPEEKEYIQNTINDAYEQFLSAILKYRTKYISEEKLRSIADGRIFTGKVAKELGLIDQIGNLQDAIDKAKELAGVPQARVFYMEKKKGLLREILESNAIPPDLYYPTMIYYIMK